MNTLDFDFSIFVSLALIKLIDNKLSAFSCQISIFNYGFLLEQNKVGGGTHTNKINLRDLYRVSIPLPHC